MKSLFILSILVSFNAFSADVGEKKEAICSASDQTSKREAKVVESEVQSDKKVESKVKSK